MVTSQLVVCDFSMKINIMRQNENLLYVIAMNTLFQIVSVIVTNLYHFAYNSAYYKQGATIHTGNWIVNYYNLVFTNIAIVKASSYKM